MLQIVIVFCGQLCKHTAAVIIIGYLFDVRYLQVGNFSFCINHEALVISQQGGCVSGMMN